MNLAQIPVFIVADEKKYSNGASFSMNYHLLKPRFIHCLIDQRFCHLLSDTASDCLSKEPKLPAGPTSSKLSTLSLLDSKRF